MFTPKNYHTLVVFRVLFGVITLFSSLRFFAKGWIEELYLTPTFHFKYFGFSWVEIASPSITYLLFTLMIISSLFILFGLFYRVATISFFLLFTYFELIDLTNYLNHYYFVSLVALLMIFLPANINFSLDTRFGLVKKKQTVQAWTINSIKLQLAIVYIFAGIAKLNYEWLFQAQPLSIWLAPHTNLPIIGGLMDEKIVAYLFSFGGALFDLSVPFLLWNKSTRKMAYLLVVVFHILTSILFPIGVFPYVMILSTLIFFSSHFHASILKLFGHKSQVSEPEKDLAIKSKKTVEIMVVAFFIFQFLFPFRYLLYSGDLFWTEQGYRFSWRVMLMEKAGYASFKVFPYGDDRSITVQNSDFLTPQQEKMMSTQPDFIIQYAHFIGKHYQVNDLIKPIVNVDSYVSINGKGSQSYVKNDLDLMLIKNSLKPIDFLEDYN
ncbi:HTTM domain-containing protein [Flavobacteriales bacterium]|nr:HTTM domain-containing protein [Flavobacteriales bacterium]